ncbi:MAG: TIGR02757 family protein [Marinoscillum sp.]|nr:TIGR02757 family protein [Marinoscillum sp.]OUX26845.1 MAG: TIGR02757 family protein [Flammeovirgaceae bacterium TMED262]|tara:strand:+ start:1327 stop:2094 length:768 start_codon:yes stop_codon:yes gene_type:complete
MKRVFSDNDLKNLLEEKFLQYNNTDFIYSDPIQIPHRFNKKEDIEISAFLTSIISWGNRKMIINNADKMMKIMGDSPHDFIINSSERNINSISFVHRTFNSDDFKFFIMSLKNIYLNHGGLENTFSPKKDDQWIFDSITRFKNIFFSIDHLKRTKKHISDPAKRSACKRINMFLRWMVRKDLYGVDFGIWNNILPSILSCPLDTHTLRISKELNLISRSQNDIKTLIQLDKKLRYFDPIDPVKYDYALFGLGVDK